MPAIKCRKWSFGSDIKASRQFKYASASPVFAVCYWPWSLLIAGALLLPLLIFLSIFQFGGLYSGLRGDPFLTGDDYIQRSHSKYSPSNQQFKHLLGVLHFTGQITRCWFQILDFSSSLKRTIKSGGKAGVWAEKAFCFCAQRAKGTAGILLICDTSK